MPVQFLGVGSAAASTGGVTPGLPSGLAVDDLLIMAVETTNTDTPSPPAGWTAMPGSGTGDASENTKLTWWYHFYTGAAPSTTIADPGDHVLAQIAAFRGVDTSTPFEASAAQRVDGGGSSSYFPGITTTVNWVMVVAAGVTTDDVDVFSNYPYPVQQTFRAATTQGNDGSIHMVHRYQPTAGATGDITFDINTTRPRVLATVGLIPADAGVDPALPSRVSQAATEPLVQSTDAAARLSQTAAETLAQADTAIRLSQVAAEALVQALIPARLSQTAIEVLARQIFGGVWYVRQGGSFLQAPVTVRQDPDWLGTLTLNLDAGVWNPEV